MNKKEIQEKFLELGQKEDFLKAEVKKIELEILDCADRGDLKKLLKKYREIYPKLEEASKKSLDFFKKYQDKITDVDW
jgi:hypothetical protein